jgi:Sulfotransferase domain
VRRKVFGLGLNKTGTTTLGRCLKRLGFDHLSCRRDLLIAYRENRIADVFFVVDKYESFEDWPYPLMYRELFDRYGSDAKFILTTRSSSSAWLDSLKHHSLGTHPDNHCRLLAYGYNYPHGYENEHVEFYNAHNRAVREFFRNRNASSQLVELCWESGQGWRELCEFLGLEPPADDFPHANKRSEVSNREWREENVRRILTQQEERRRSEPPASA